MLGGIITALASLSLLAFAMTLTLFLALAVPTLRRRLSELVGEERRPPTLVVAWLAATLATAGSLYLSASGFEPCRFCWYQRIAMYPLVMIVGVALLRGDTGVWRYILALAIPGVLLSAYHVALQLQPALEITECSATAPCTARYFAVFGFVSIPVMAGAAFSLIIALAGVTAVAERAGTRA